MIVASTEPKLEDSRGRQWEVLIPWPSEDQGGTSVSEETFPVYRLEGGFENLAQSRSGASALMPRVQTGRAQEGGCLSQEPRGQEGAGSKDFMIKSLIGRFVLSGQREDNSIRKCRVSVVLLSEATRPSLHQQLACVTTLPLREIQMFFLYGNFLLGLF